MEKLKQNVIFIIVGCAIVLFFSVSFIRNFDNSEVVHSNSIVAVEEAEDSPVLEKVEVELDIYVDIKGAVRAPGVYKMRNGDRVIDVIEKANGLELEANKDAINLALLVEDEMVIYVPFKGANTEELELEFIPTTKEKSNKININQASTEDLQQLPGIGPAKAGAIIAYREEHGKFQTVDDLVKVSGIGKKTVEKMLEFIDVK